ncbi:hypothetical protein [Paenibacillus pinihumi]|uniref:hypothetical protein n=1 Tax=Paenibacillus pinihumi TaxID=669462 RepID=UPI0012B542C5|nr:hypothetical protein [Paenibacillus pinihumi]
MKRRKILPALILVGSIALGSISLSSFAAQSNLQVVSGGWSENEGYFVNYAPNLKSNSVVSSSNSTPVHYGRTESRERGSVLERRVIADTKWLGVYHYSRARFENIFTGTPYADSGRVYGTSYTTAYSDWRDSTGEIAKTYYGID